MSSVEVIVSVHANARALDLALLALSRQLVDPCLVCVAEDGEHEAVREVVARRRADFPEGSIRHVAQPYLGFRKNRILNRAVATSGADYLVFLDGDCLASPGFLSRHLALRRPGRFVTGGVIRLGSEASAAVTPDLCVSGRVFDRGWLCDHGVVGFAKFLKSGGLAPGLADVLERFAPTARTWNGGNVSGWRSDLLAVNGFDESLGYGAEDVDLGFRLNRLGVAGRHVRYTAPVLHLHHERPYSSDEERARNCERVASTRLSVPIRARRGIELS